MGRPPGGKAARRDISDQNHQACFPDTTTVWHQGRRRSALSRPPVSGVSAISSCRSVLGLSPKKTLMSVSWFPWCLQTEPRTSAAGLGEDVDGPARQLVRCYVRLRMEGPGVRWRHRSLSGCAVSSLPISGQGSTVRGGPGSWKEKAGEVRSVWYPMCVHLFYTYKRNHPPSAPSPKKVSFYKHLKIKTK